MLSFATKLHQNEKCLGTRKILSEEDEVQKNGRVFKKYVMGDYEWRSYVEVERLAEYFGRGLRELGHEERQKVVIFAETRAEWMIAAHGCFRQNFPVVTIYATLGDDGVIHGRHRSYFMCCIIIVYNGYDDTMRVSICSIVLRLAIIALYRVR